MIYGNSVHLECSGKSFSEPLNHFTVLIQNVMGTLEASVANCEASFVIQIFNIVEDHRVIGNASVTVRRGGK